MRGVVQYPFRVNSPRVVILAGPNGAGKTTFARRFLPEDAGVPNFINADLIAAGLSPFNPDAAALRAGRVMLEQISAAVTERTSFAIETTLAGKMYGRRIPQWQRRGYHVSLVFLQLESPELAIERVAGRVRRGGHDIPEPVIRRRWEKGRFNFETLYRPLVDAWWAYDNSGAVAKLLDQGVRS